MIKYKNAIKYYTVYEKFLNKISKMFSINSDLTIKKTKIIIQKFMFANVNEMYILLIA